MTISIPLTKGFVAIVDAADKDLAQSNWFASKGKTNTYAMRQIPPRSKDSFQLLHRVVFERMIGRSLLKSELVDHEDLNPMNCVRSNLRLATRSQNAANQKISKANTSGFKGVSWNSAKQRWNAHITVNRKHKYLGSFLSPELAHEAYCKAGRELYGEFFNPG